MLSQPLFLSSKGWEEIYFVTNHVLDLAGLWPPPDPQSLLAACLVLPRCSLASGGHPKRLSRTPGAVGREQPGPPLGSLPSHSDPPDPCCCPPPVFMASFLCLARGGPAVPPGPVLPGQGSPEVAVTPRIGWHRGAARGRCLLPCCLPSGIFLLGSCSAPSQLPRLPCPFPSRAHKGSPAQGPPQGGRAAGPGRLGVVWIPSQPCKNPKK